MSGLDGLVTRFDVLTNEDVDVAEVGLQLRVGH